MLILHATVLGGCDTVQSGKEYWNFQSTCCRYSSKSLHNSSHANSTNGTQQSVRYTVNTQSHSPRHERV